jgi:hypothetical protein
MAYTVPVVSYAAVNNFEGTYTALTGIQSVSINRGRRRFQDQFAPTVCTIELIPANSYTVPLEVGQWIDVRTSNVSSADAYFTGRISDVERDYSFPYNSGTGAAPADRITITALGAMGSMGLGGPIILLPATTETADARGNIGGAALGAKIYQEFVLAATVGADNYNKFGVSTTVSSGGQQSRLDLINYLTNAGQAYADDIDMSRVGKKVGGVIQQTLQIHSYRSSTRTWTFSDNPGVGEFKYTGINYLSGAQETFDKIIVNGWDSSLAPQNAGTSVSAPLNALSYRTQLNSEATMLNLANYLLTVQNDTEPTPVVIRTNTLVADGIETKCYMSKLPAPQTASWFDQILGSVITIEFRGTTVLAQVQGVNINFYDSHANFEFYLSPSLGVPFTLDSTTNGVLDTNRLGYP